MSTKERLQRSKWSVVGRSYVIACEVGKDGKFLRIESFSDGDQGTYHATGLPIRARPRGDVDGAVI